MVPWDGSAGLKWGGSMSGGKGLGHPYKGGQDRYFGAQLAFDRWREWAEVAVREEVLSISRGAILDQVHCLCIMRTQTTLQIWFGNRPVPDRQAIGGGAVTESGATLTYSLGANGFILVLLSPASSNLHSFAEQHVRLEVKPFSAARLRRDMRQHVKDLIAYHYVSSLDGRPTLPERVRVEWLRHTRPCDVDGETIVRWGRPVGWISQRVTQAAIGSFLVPIAIVILIGLLSWLGWDFAVDLLKGRLTRLSG